MTIAKRDLKTLILVTSLVISATACSTKNTQTEKIHDTTESWDVSIFAARKSLLSKEYERFVVKDDLIFEECGKLRLVSKLRAKDELEDTAQNLTIGRFSAQRSSKYARQLTREEISKISQLASSTNSLKHAHSKEPIAKPDLSSEGLFEMSLQNSKTEPNIILTSFDTIVQRETKVAAGAQELYKLLRSLPGGSCGKRTFFGIN